MIKEKKRIQNFKNNVHLTKPLLFEFIVKQVLEYVCNKSANLETIFQAL